MTEAPEQTALRELIEDTAADLSQAEPFWTAGCLAKALIARGVTTSSAFAAREADLVGALREISDLHGEINPSNYDHDDACELNRQFVYAITIADAALQSREARHG